MANVYDQNPKTQKKMNPVWIIIALAVLVALGVLAFSLLNNPASQSTQTTPRSVSVDDAFQMRKNGALILDVREQSEWEEVHIPGATLIPLAQLPDRLAEVPKDQEVVVVCRSGSRSQSGRDILRDAGFSQVTSMDGGMNTWVEKGYPTENGR